MADRLYRSRDDRMLAGVAGGVAEHLDADPSLIRIVWAVLIFLTGGLALLVYIVMAIVVPERPAGHAAPPCPTPGRDAAPRRPAPSPTGSWVAPDGSTVPMAPSTARRAPRAAAIRPIGRAAASIGGLILIVLGGLFLVRQFIPLRLRPVVADRRSSGSGSLLVVVAARCRQPPFELTARSRTMGRVESFRSVGHRRSPAAASSPGWSCSRAGSAGYRSVVRVGDTSTSTDRLAGRRRGPRQRGRRTGRDDPRLAPPERPVRLLPRDDRQRRRPTDAPMPATPRSARSGSASATRPAACGSSRAAPGSTRRSGSRARPSLAATSPGLDSGAAGRPRSTEIDRALAVAALLDGPRPGRRPTRSPGCATGAAVGPTARRGSSRATR